jgi:putative hydrolase of the HAD superfamily
MINVKYRAVFFDRDGTLSQQDPEIIADRDRRISEIIGNKFTLDDDLNMKVFYRVWELYPELKPVKNIETEDLFWEKWFQLLLIESGAGASADENAEILCRDFMFYTTMKLYPETIEVLEYFKNRGLIMGVISDTFPSLELTLELLGIRKYFDNVTASSLVGVGKPNPRIFNHALNDVQVSAEESYFVDDTKPEADGAREMGFTSFYLDRNMKTKDQWTIPTLRELVEFDKDRYGGPEL